MVKITTQEQRNELKVLFSISLSDPLLDSAFHGHNGHIVVDHVNTPTMLFVDVGGTVYFFGDASTKQAIDLLSSIGDYAEIQANTAWTRLIKKHYKDKVHHRTRYDMDGANVSLAHLEQLTLNPPSDLYIKQIDGPLYDHLLTQDWTSSMVENFQNKIDYLKNGLGFVLLNKTGDVLAGASSFARFSKGYEVEIATDKNHRQKGYATLIGAVFISEVLKRGYTAHWDAANKESVALAKRLGYVLHKEYDIIVVY